MSDVFLIPPDPKDASLNLASLPDKFNRLGDFENPSNPLIFVAFTIKLYFY
jgi:hypothetical protein